MKKTIILLVFFIFIYFLLISNNYKLIESSVGVINRVESTNWIIDIPKIKLYKEISKSSDIDHNIIVINPSDFPNKEKTLILAAHSGSSKYSFFNDLYKLKKNDKVFLRNSNKIYRYKIVNIYKQNKTGTVKIYKDDDKTNLVLITCTNNDNKTQTIYILELI